MIKKVFDLALFKLNCSKNRITRSYLISKTLAKLGDTKRKPHTSRINNISKINKNSLCCFSPQISHAAFSFNNSQLDRKKKIKPADYCPVVFTTIWTTKGIIVLVAKNRTNFLECF